MPTSAVPERVRAMLEQANPAVITTVRPDGQPVSVATWYLWDNGRVFVNMDAGRKRLEYLRHDPRVSLTVLADGNWYTHVSLQGRVAEFADDPDLSGIDRLSRHYRGQPYPTRDRARVNAWIDIDRWHAWGDLARDEA